MTGVYTPTEGKIRFKGKEIAGTKPYKINHLGIARTFQNIRLFPEMSAMENVMVGCDARHKTSVPGVLFRLYRSRPTEGGAAGGRPASEPRQGVRHQPSHPGGAGRSQALDGAAALRRHRRRAHELARNLPYGYQRRLEIARALATEPELICLDEPAAGFNPAEKEDLMGLIRRIRDLGHPVLVIEHDMKLVLGVTDASSCSSSARRSRRAARKRSPATRGHRRLPGRARRCCLR